MEPGIGQTVRYGPRLAALWDDRLRAADFPDPQVRLSLRALLPGVRRLPQSPAHGKHLTLILAGNTPLVGWPATLYGLALGWSVTVKRSRHERVWIDALAESLPPEWAERLSLVDADHAGAAALVAAADASIAYGSDAALAALNPTLGFGHALSVAVWPAGGQSLPSWLAVDTLAYDQAGCLSPQAVFVEPGFGVAAALRTAFRDETERLGPPRRTDPAERRLVREARDLAAMDGCDVYGDDDLRWTVIVHPETRPLPPPTGLCVLHVIPVTRAEDFVALLGPATGRLSCVGVAGHASDGLRAAARAAGASRICRTGQMQTPPLDWPNGGVDLAAWLGQAISPPPSAISPVR